MNNNKGFGLLETVIAMFILGMGLIAAVGLYASTSRNNTNGNILSLEWMSVKTQLESLRATNLVDLQEGTFTKQDGPVVVSWTITKDPSNTRLGRAIITATCRKKTVVAETRLDNQWGKEIVKAIPIPD